VVLYKQILLWLISAIAIGLFSSCSDSKFIRESMRVYPSIPPNVPIKYLYSENAPLIPITAQHIATVATSANSQCTTAEILKYIDKEAHNLGANLVFIKKIINKDIVEYYYLGLVSTLRTVHCHEYLVDFLFDTAGGYYENN